MHFHLFLPTFLSRSLVDWHPRSSQIDNTPFSEFHPVQLILLTLWSIPIPYPFSCHQLYMARALGISVFPEEYQNVRFLMNIIGEMTLNPYNILALAIPKRQVSSRRKVRV
jgi:hypothetical protein